MIKLFLTTLLFVSFYSLQAQNTGVELNIKGWDNDTIFLLKYIWGEQDETLDTLKASNGKVIFYGTENDTTGVIFFAAKNKLPRPDGMFTIPSATAVQTIIFPQIYEKIDGELKNGAVIYTSSGLKYHKELALEHNRFIPLNQKADSINARLEYLINQNQQEERKQLFEARGKIYKQIQEKRKEYILSNPNSQLAGNNLCQIGFEDRIKLEPILADSVRNGIFKNKINTSIRRAKEYMAVQQAKERIKAGNPAPEFELADTNGNLHSLSGLKGKWVVLDFWGSWCGWCIKGIPDMKKAYEKHKSKMEIVGIACRDTETQWKNAIVEHKLPWLQLIDDKTKNIPVMYAVEGYPTKIIIDPQGIIKNVTIGEDPKFYSILDEMLGQ